VSPTTGQAETWAAGVPEPGHGTTKGELENYRDWLQRENLARRAKGVAEYEPVNRPTSVDYGTAGNLAYGLGDVVTFGLLGYTAPNTQPGSVIV